jgi:hypothetical protein
MRMIRVVLVALALAVYSGGARADYFVLRSGARMNVNAYQLLGERYRVQINGGTAEIAACEVVAIEPEEIFVAAPRTPLVQAPYGQLIQTAAEK